MVTAKRWYCVHERPEVVLQGSGGNGVHRVAYAAPTRWQMTISWFPIVALGGVDNWDTFQGLHEFVPTELSHGTIHHLHAVHHAMARFHTSPNTVRHSRRERFGYRPTNRKVRQTRANEEFVRRHHQNVVK